MSADIGKDSRDVVWLDQCFGTWCLVWKYKVNKLYIVCNIVFLDKQHASPAPSRKCRASVARPMVRSPFRIRREGVGVEVSETRRTNCNKYNYYYRMSLSMTHVWPKYSLLRPWCDQNINQEVSKRSHIGENRLHDGILSEVMAQVEPMEKAFKFSDDIKKCQWDQTPHLNPPPRLNSHNSVITPS